MNGPNGEAGKTTPTFMTLEEMKEADFNVSLITGEPAS